MRGVIGLMDTLARLQNEGEEYLFHKYPGIRISPQEVEEIYNQAKGRYVWGLLSVKDGKESEYIQPICLGKALEFERFRYYVRSVDKKYCFIQSTPHLSRKWIGYIIAPDYFKPFIGPNLQSAKQIQRLSHWKFETYDVESAFKTANEFGQNLWGIYSRDSNLAVELPFDVTLIELKDYLAAVEFSLELKNGANWKEFLVVFLHQPKWRKLWASV